MIFRLVFTLGCNLRVVSWVCGGIISQHGADMTSINFRHWFSSEMRQNCCSINCHSAPTWRFRCAGGEMTHFFCPRKILHRRHRCKLRVHVGLRSFGAAKYRGKSEFSYQYHFESSRRSHTIYSPLQSELVWTGGGKFHILCSRSTNTQTPLYDPRYDGGHLEPDSRWSACPNRIQGAGFRDSRIYRKQHGFSSFPDSIASDVLNEFATTLRVRMLARVSLCVFRVCWSSLGINRYTRGQP